MYKALLTGLLAAGLLTPVAAYAQPASSTALAPETKTERMLVILPGQILAIGAGVVVGVVAIEALIPTELGYLVGGIIGGYVANIWYHGQWLEIQAGTPPKA